MMLVETVSNYKYRDLGTLNAVGETDIVDTLYGMDKITWQHVNDATLTAPNIILLGSIDGDKFFDLDASDVIGGEMRCVNNMLVRYVKVKINDMGDATNIDIKLFIKE